MKTRNAVTRIAVSGPLLDELVFQREEVSRFVLRTNLQSGSSESVQCHERERERIGAVTLRSFPALRFQVPLRMKFPFQ